MNSVYQQYLFQYSDINNKIYSIDQLPPEQRSQSNVIQDRSTLVSLQQQLYQIYLSSKTLSDYVQNTTTIMNRVTSVFNDALSLNPPSLPPVVPPSLPPVTPPSLPPITPNGIEHSTWMITWTSWTFPLPSNVTMINLFVGEFTLQSDGSVLIGGFGNANNTIISQLSKSASANNIGVKISLGGGGGSYTNIWNLITLDNVQLISQALSNFCLLYELSGVDFDIETFTSETDRPELQILCGNLIKYFKITSPKLQTSLCVNAGFGPNFPWTSITTNILNGSMYNGNTCVDRVYIMSYYDPLASEQGWINGWVKWLSETYSFTPSRVSVGLDDKDAHAYEIGEFARWAKINGLSTAYWNYDPNQIMSSEQSLQTIMNSYYS